MSSQVPAFPLHVISYQSHGPALRFRSSPLHSTSALHPSYLLHGIATRITALLHISDADPRSSRPPPTRAKQFRCSSYRFCSQRRRAVSVVRVADLIHTIACRCYAKP
jgi:hypothetical protein